MLPCWNWTPNLAISEEFIVSYVTVIILFLRSEENLKFSIALNEDSMQWKDDFGSLAKIQMKIARPFNFR